MKNFNNSQQSTNYNNFLFLSNKEKNRYYIRKHSDQNLGLGIIPNGIINLVEPFSPADKAGVIKGLKITSINDIDVKEKNNKEIQKMVSENQNFLVIEAVLLYADKNLQQDLPETPSLTEETSDFNVQRFLNNNVRRMTTKTDRLQGQDVFEGLTKNKITPEKDRRQQTNPQQITNGRQQNKQQRHASFEEIEESVYSSSLSEISVPVTTNPVKRPSNFNQTNEFGKSPSKSSAIASRIVSDKKPSIVTTNLTKPKHSTAEIYTETSNSVIPSADIYARADSLKPVEQLIGSRTCRLLMNSNFGGYGCVLVGDEVNGIVYVGSIMPNSPALLGGLQQEDIILRINDESMTGKTSTEIVNIFSKETLIDSDTGKSILKLEVIQKKLYLPDHLETR